MLTPKQQRFVEEFLIDLCATKAAVRAGYSKKTANEQGAQLLGLPKVRTAIDAAKIKRSERVQADADYVLQRLVNEVEADLADLFDANGNLRPMDQWPEIWRTGLVQSVETESICAGGAEIGKTKKIRLSDRLRRLELIGKHVQVNAFQETVRHNRMDGLGDRLQRATKRIHGQ